MKTVKDIDDQIAALRKEKFSLQHKESAMEFLGTFAYLIDPTYLPGSKNPFIKHDFNWMEKLYEYLPSGSVKKGKAYWAIGDVFLAAVCSDMLNTSLKKKFDYFDKEITEVGDHHINEVVKHDYVIVDEECIYFADSKEEILKNEFVSTNSRVYNLAKQKQCKVEIVIHD